MLQWVLSITGAELALLRSGGWLIKPNLVTQDLPEIQVTRNWVSPILRYFYAPERIRAY